MIFYFSGTGNSKHIAERIAKSTGERLVYISESIIAKNETYDIEENERIGFIFPVYWYCMPKIVEKFIVQLKLSGYQKQYVYAITSYGIAAGNVMDRLIKTLNNMQIQLNGIFGVQMVDNYVVGYNIVNVDKPYRKANHIKKYFVTKECNGCKQCESNCPCNVIHMRDGKPTWVGECTFCLKCINGCKQSAIQYGKFTEKRARYQYK